CHTRSRSSRSVTRKACASAFRWSEVARWRVASIRRCSTAAMPRERRCATRSSRSAAMPTQFRRFRARTTTSRHSSRSISSRARYCSIATWHSASSRRSPARRGSPPAGPAWPAMRAPCRWARAATEMTLFVESYTAASRGVLVGTVGKLAVAGGGAINVIPGEVALTIDVRAGRDAERLAAVAAIERECRAIALRRNVALEWANLFELAAAPCDERLQAALAASVAAQGIEPFRLPSGAGHDAMEMAHVAPIGMLFVRCGNGGISHHPDETMTAADANLATHALVHFLAHFDAAAMAATAAR